jgi:uncharacterized protein
MEFQNFGQKSFVLQARIQGFVDHLEQGRLMANRCTDCRKLLFPPKTFCCTCGSDKMEWVEITETGRLMTFTTVYYGPSGFESEVPYTLAVVNLPNGINLFGQMDKAIPLEKIKIGMALKAVPIRLGESQYTYRLESA